MTACPPEHLAELTSRRRRRRRRRGCVPADRRRCTDEIAPGQFEPVVQPCSSSAAARGPDDEVPSVGQTGQEEALSVVGEGERREGERGREADGRGEDGRPEEGHPATRVAFLWKKGERESARADGRSRAGERDEG